MSVTHITAEFDAEDKIKDNDQKENTKTETKKRGRGRPKKVKEEKKELETQAKEEVKTSYTTEGEILLTMLETMKKELKGKELDQNMKVLWLKAYSDTCEKHGSVMSDKPEITLLVISICLIIDTIDLQKLLNQENNKGVLDQLTDKVKGILPNG